MGMPPEALMAALQQRQGPPPQPSPIAQTVAGGVGESPLLKLINLLSAVAEQGGAEPPMDPMAGGPPQGPPPGLPF